uniref:Uncharacterized protein n=1 Tax=Arundo donax TaxID=35708 RepID=A0A0A9EX86_ARUDO
MNALKQDQDNHHDHTKRVVMRTAIVWNAHLHTGYVNIGTN